MSTQREPLNFTTIEIQSIDNTFEDNSGVNTGSPKEHPKACCCCFSADEISPKADPPVCRIIEFNKFIYERKKKEKEIKAKTVQTTVKEIRFGPNTDDHDFDAINHLLRSEFRRPTGNNRVIAFAAKLVGKPD